MPKNLHRFSLLFAFWVALSGCGINSAKRSYVMAENLWADGKYAAAVAEFEKVIAKDPGGKLGLMALTRAASTQALFLEQYPEAVRKLRTFAEINPDADAAWDARRQIGDLLFEKMDSYEEAIRHYRQMIQLRPDSPEVPEFLFRVAKSQFFLQRFPEAIQVYREVIQKYPTSLWREKAAYEVGVTFFTRGGVVGRGKGSGMESYQQAIDAFQGFLKAYPQSPLAVQARFGIANCLEELDQLDNAYQAYLELRGKYPSPNVIEIKLARIKERKAQRVH